MQLFIALFVAVAVFSTACVSADRKLFADFIQKYQKSYQAVEHEIRYQNFVVSLERIAKRNAQHGTEKAVFGVNQFSDLSTAEFQKFYLNNGNEATLSKNINDDKSNVMKGLNIQRTFNWGDNTTVDWTTTGATTPVKDQGQCGSCWAFSATEELESMTFLGGNDLPVLAPQQIVDCDTHGSDQGCNGGFTEGAYAYVQSAGGMDTEASYPYTARDGKCKFNSNSVAATLTGYTYAVPKCNTLFGGKKCDKNCKDMDAALQTAPISVCLNALSWQDYQGGIIRENVCTDSRADHCVQLVGYNTNADGDYYIVRNSWNTIWGEKGYIWLQRGEGVNACGLCNDATIVTV